MKRFTKIHALMLMIFMFAGTTIPVSAVERPFALSGTGVATLITDESGAPIGAIPTGSGTATHLGQWTVSGNVKYTRDENGMFHSSGEASLIASNGDRLNFQIEGILDTTAFVDQGVFRFVGGTGRFENATGEANFVVNINPVTGGALHKKSLFWDFSVQPQCPLCLCGVVLLGIHQPQRHRG
ncbi:MAG TPA: hypothetical protein VJ784_13185, partial [Pyrinomonadaceae bacterium]|nr:hypothetical protein [Pyrinomonadaceae bacterium]